MALSQERLDAINKEALTNATSLAAAKNLIGLDRSFSRKDFVNSLNPNNQGTPGIESFNEYANRKGFINNDTFQGSLGKPASTEKATLPNTTMNVGDYYKEIQNVPTLLPKTNLGDASQFTTYNQTPILQGEMGKPISNEQGLMPNTTRPSEDYYNEVNAVPTLLPQIPLGSIPVADRLEQYNDMEGSGISTGAVANPESKIGIRPFIQDAPVIVSPLDPGPQDPMAIQLQDSGGRADIEINGPTRESTIPLTGVNAPPQGTFINGEFVPYDKLETQKAGEGIKLDAPPEVTISPLSQVDDPWAKFVQANQSDQVKPQDLNFGRHSNVKARAMDLLKRISAIG